MGIVLGVIGAIVAIGNSLFHYGCGSGRISWLLKQSQGPCFMIVFSILMTIFCSYQWSDPDPSY